MTELVLIAAVADNGVIGRENALAWRLKSDMQHFRTLTMGKPVIMGRKTYLSVGKPLKGRTTIVVSRDPAFAAPGAIVARDLGTAIASARGDALRRGAGDIMVAGGGEIYRATLPLADRVELTRVHVRPLGDAHFPDLDLAIWREIASDTRPAGPEDDAPFTFLTYRRVRAA
jgi:dihydrofolate reductase